MEKGNQQKGLSGNINSKLSFRIKLIKKLKKPQPNNKGLWQQLNSNANKAVYKKLTLKELESTIEDLFYGKSKV